MLDRADGALDDVGTGHIVRCREDRHGVELLDDLAGQRMQRVQRLDLVTEQLDADGVLFVDGDDLDGVSAHTEVAPREVDIVAVVLHGDKLTDERIAVIALPHLEGDHGPQILFRRPESVDAGHCGDHDDIASAQQRVGRRMPQSLDFGVDRGVLLDEGVGLRYVRLRLVVVVVRDEVLDRVVGHELAELVRELGGEGLVVREHERGTLDLFDQPGRRGGLAGTRRAEKHHVCLTGIDARRQIGDGLRLVSGRLILADDLEGADTARGLHTSSVCRPSDIEAVAQDQPRTGVHTYGVVVDTFTSPDRSRIGRENSVESEWR